MKGAIHDFINSSYTSGKKKAPEQTAPRSEKPIIQPRGLGLGGLLTLHPRYSRLRPGKHSCQLWVRAAEATTPRGQPQPHLQSSEDVNPSPMLWSTSYPRMAHRMKCWCAPWDGPAKSPGKPDGMFTAWGVRGLWGRARWRGSHGHPQISRAPAGGSLLEPGEPSTGAAEGANPFRKGKARSQRK